MQIGKRRWETVAAKSKSMGVLPVHKSTGKPSPAAIDHGRANVIREHFEYLLELGEVRATRVIATLVDGEQGHTNREDTVDMVYLPLSFGFRPCYARYMNSLGYNVTCRPNGGIIVEGIDGKVVDRKEFVSFATYCPVSKKDYPQLKVSKPVEDICQHCFVFANRHRYLANHSAMNVCTEFDEDGDEISVVRDLVVENNGAPQQQDSVGGELNIIFDNCLGKNKNNTVLKLAMWLKAMGYFERVNFIFFIVGHTKNAADRLFSSLKHEYWKKNIFTMDCLIAQLNQSNHQNNIFSCSGVEDKMTVQESNIAMKMFQERSQHDTLGAQGIFFRACACQCAMCWD